MESFAFDNFQTIKEGRKKIAASRLNAVIKTLEVQNNQAELVQKCQKLFVEYNKFEIDNSEYEDVNQQLLNLVDLQLKVYENFQLDNDQKIIYKNAKLKEKESYKDKEKKYNYKKRHLSFLSKLQI